jgi:hypothetical protein
MKRPFRRVVLAVVVAAVLAALTAVPQQRADAANFEDIGGDDTMIFLTPWETKYLYSVLDNPGSVPCTVPILPSLVSELFGKLNNICQGISKLYDADFLAVKAHLYVATQWDACGGFVIDDAPWRWWTKYRPADQEAAGVPTTFVFLTLGKQRVIEGILFECNEWANPPVESNIINAPPPPIPTPTPILGFGS